MHRSKTHSARRFAQRGRDRRRHGWRRWLATAALSIAAITYVRHRAARTN